MKLIIDLDKIDDIKKRVWLIKTLKLMDIQFHQRERRQTLDEYNEDLEAGEAEIDRGEYITAEELKAKIGKWKS